MTSEDRAIVGVLGAGAVVIPLLLGLSLGWPVWLWAILIVVLLIVPAAVAPRLRHRAQRKRLGELQAQQPIPDHQPPPDQRPMAVYSAQIREVPLPSARPDYDFVLTAVVYWQAVVGQGAPHANPGALAIDAIVLRAREAAASEQPDRYTLLQHHLNSALGTMLPDRSGRVLAWADQVLVDLSEVDLNRLRRLADVRKDEDVWEHERNHERNKRKYLGDEVLRTTGSAVVWWLSKDDGDLTRAVTAIGPLARLTAAANDQEVPELFRRLVEASEGTGQSPFSPMGSDGAGHPFGFDFVGDGTGQSVVDRLTRLMDALGLDDAQRAQFADRAVNLVDATGNTAAADQIRAHFDVDTDTDVEEDAEHTVVDADTTEDPVWESGHPDDAATTPVGDEAD